MKTRKLKIKRKVVVKSRKKGKLNRKISYRRKQRKSIVRRRTRQNKYRRHNLKKRFSRKMSGGGSSKNLRYAKEGSLEPPAVGVVANTQQIARGFVSSLVSSVPGQWKSYYFKKIKDGEEDEEKWERTDKTVLDVGEWVNHDGNTEKVEKEVLGTGENKNKAYFHDSLNPFTLLNIQTFYKHGKMYKTPFAIYKKDAGDRYYIIWENTQHYLQRFQFRGSEKTDIINIADTVYIYRSDGANNRAPHKIVRLNNKNTAIDFVRWIDTHATFASTFPSPTSTVTDVTTELDPLSSASSSWSSRIETGEEGDDQ